MSEKVQITPFNPTSHVLVPVALFGQMSACFYGNGPNYWETRKIPPPSKAPNRTILERLKEAAPEEEDIEDGPVVDPDYLEALRSGTPFESPTGMRVVPLGEAARILDKESNPEKPGLPKR